MANVLCLDFDDTITLDNTARRLFERFAAPAWQEAEEAYRRGDLTVEQYNARALELVEARPDELRAFVRETTRVREGFTELLDWTHWHGWVAMVVSNGFDFYVDEVLDGLNVDRVARHAGRTRFAYRWRVRYRSPRGIEVQEGFKLAYAQALHEAGDFVVYVGDGASDVEAARLAAVVFARDTLWARLKDEHDRIFPFDSLADVVAILDRESAGWHAVRREEA